MLAEIQKLIHSLIFTVQACSHYIAVSDWIKMMPIVSNCFSYITPQGLSVCVHLQFRAVFSALGTVGQD